MPLSFFDILRSAIDQEVQNQISASGISVNEVYDRIQQEAERNHQEWYSNRVPALNYHLPECRLAYLYIVAAANAGTFFQVLKKNQKLEGKILNLATTKREIKVCAFGAGPGTELLGMAKYLDGANLGHSVSVDFHLLDIAQEWASSWYGIRESVNDYFRNKYGTDRPFWPMIPAGNFLTCDVRKINSLQFWGAVWNQDIYVINFLLSEIFENNPGLHAFISAIAEKAPIGSMFVFIERNGYMWQERISEIAAHAGLSLSPFMGSKGTLWDNPNNLGALYQHLQTTRCPRLNWNVVYSIGEKR